MTKHLPHFEAHTSGRIRFRDDYGHVRAFTWKQGSSQVTATVSGWNLARKVFTVSELRFLYLHVFLTVGGWTGNWRPLKRRQIPLYPDYRAARRGTSAILQNPSTPDRRRSSGMDAR